MVGCTAKPIENSVHRFSFGDMPPMLLLVYSAEPVSRVPLYHGVVEKHCVPHVGKGLCGKVLSFKMLTLATFVMFHTNSLWIINTIIQTSLHLLIFYHVCG